jgi:hypothetical protein
MRQMCETTRQTTETVEAISKNQKAGIITHRHAHDQIIPTILMAGAITLRNIHPKNSRILSMIIVLFPTVQTLPFA